MRDHIKVRKGIVAILLGAVSILTVNVQQGCAVQTMKLNKKKLTLEVGEKRKLKVYHAAKVKWKSKKSSIATVSKKGIVYARKKGVVKIVATVKKKKFICKVTVTQKKKTALTTSVPSTASVPNPTATPAVNLTGTQEINATVHPGGSPVPIATATPTSSPAPDPETQVVWEDGEKSGTEDDFNRYFNVDMNDYQKKKDSVISGTIESISYHSEIVGGEREAYVYLPAGYSEEKEYPVLYMIHGLGCTREQWYSMSLNNILSNMIARQEVVPFIAVLPSVVPKDGLDKDTFSSANIQAFADFEQEFIRDLEPYILEHYSVSKKAEDTGVCGLSMGGMEALRLGFSVKDHFNYIGSFSAAPSLDQQILNIHGWSFAPKVVMVCTGTKDNTVKDNPYQYHMSLLNNQVEHIWYMYPNGGHSDPVWKNGLVNFLKKSF